MVDVYTLINGWASQFLKWLVGSALLIFIIEAIVVYYTVRNNRRIHEKLDRINAKLQDREKEKEVLHNDYNVK